MTRGVWAALAMCAVGVGCAGPQYYPPPPDELPPPEKVKDTATTVQIIDQRPEWEKKPFTGTVTMYHLAKAHPNPWSQLQEETKAVVATMPQKPERVDVVVTSLRLVRIEGGGRYHDLSAGPNPNPQLAQTPQAVTRPSTGGDGRPVSSATDDGVPTPSSSSSLNLGTLFSSKDDPRRKLHDYPPGACCSIEATVRVVFSGGQTQSVDVKTFYRGQNMTHSHYMGEAIDNAAKGAAIDYNRKLRAGLGLVPDR